MAERTTSSWCGRGPQPAAQTVYQLAVARLAGETDSPFDSKFRLFAAGRWPLGVAGSRLVLF